MKLGSRIFFCYLIIFVVCFFYPINWILDNLRIRYLEGVEEPLVDQANILAAIVGHEMQSGHLIPISGTRPLITPALARFPPGFINWSRRVWICESTSPTLRESLSLIRKTSKISAKTALPGAMST
jgi:hypothetical protein